MSEPSPFKQRVLVADRVPMILQSEAAECGVACLTMISSYFGHRRSLTEMRRKFSTSVKGTSVKALMDMADALNLSARAVTLELDELSYLKCPCILHWDMKHFVVLKHVSRTHATILDPAFGERKMALSELNALFTGVALEFTPQGEFTKNTTVERAKIWEIVRPGPGFVGAIAQLFALAVIVQLFSIVSPLINQMIVDNALTRGDMDLVKVASFGMIVLLVINTAISTLRKFVGLYFSTQLSFQVQTGMLRHMMKLPSSWFEKRHVGDILSRFSSLSPIQNIATTAIPSTILDIITAITSLIMMMIYAPALGGIELGTIILFFVVRFVSFPYFKKKTDQGLHLGASAQSVFMETIRGARTFKLFSKERERIASWQGEQIGVLNNSVEVARVSTWGGAASSLLSGLQQVVIWYLGAQLVISGKMTLGMLFAFNSYTSQFTGSATSVVGQYFGLKTVNLHLERVADIALTDPEKVETGAPDRELLGELTLKGVSFKYAEHEELVLDDISLTVAAGEFVCLVGPSGQGKTTLVKLLTGLVEPTGGIVLIDGVPMDRFGLGAYRRQIGVVMQDDQLFSGTIADNVSLFETSDNQTRVEDACKKAQIHDEIMALPMGYSSFIGDMGSSLSGGQRQRLFIARALYRNPKVLFLDEGTANLDSDNEENVMKIIRSLNITRVVIAHRPAAMLGANRILSVTKGAVV